MVETNRDNDDDDDDAHQASLRCLVSSQSAVKQCSESCCKQCCNVLHLDVWSSKIPVVDGFHLFDGLQKIDTGRVRWCGVSPASCTFERSHA